ncbi:CBS domain-containing protein [Phytohabitans rumicis]|uniref:Oxidoreductase n=1 Tax=Phytohabitans rumicis TaxID=1076125 RepID=A0A6V8LD05_9ACTN|nr:CBS domain-containing protein [Phytohabitans rumicis]GFJ90555.1 oxidoreductase [Phytohabitans rumicis]
MDTHTVADVMTKQVVYLPAQTTVDEVAEAMRSADIGDVVVTDGPVLAGIVTDRDIVVRAIAVHRDPGRTAVGTIASRDLVMIQQDARIEEAARLMRERSVRRLLVCDADRQLVGVVSLSDLNYR